MKLDVATVLRATGCRVHRLRDGSLTTGNLGLADLQTGFSEVAIDSRLAGGEALFVALRGERVDGHEFVPAALESGARGCLLSRLPGLADLAGVDPTEPRYLFEVPRPLEGLQRLAAYWRCQSDAVVVGITGSIGKTTTKEIVASVLATRRPVLKSEANLNTEIGLPLMLLRLQPEHRIAVLEMGMYLPGDVGLLACMAQPRIGIVTNVAPIHLERAESIERIARGKSELVAELPAEGLAILNGDDPWTRAMAVTSGLARSLLVGMADDCDYRAVDIRAHGLTGVSFTLHAKGEEIPVHTAIPGVHTIHACLAATAVARELGMSWEEIISALQAARLDVRQRIIRRDDMVIIDDSYNAAPMSVNAALELLRESPGDKIAVLGDMLELGPEEETAHRLVGERVAGIADWLVARGLRSAWIADEATRRGMPLGRVQHVPDNETAVAAVREIVQSQRDSDGWTILVKGSRGMRMEEVVSGLEEWEWPRVY